MMADMDDSLEGKNKLPKVAKVGKKYHLNVLGDKRMIPSFYMLY